MQDLLNWLFLANSDVGILLSSLNVYRAAVNRLVVGSSPTCGASFKNWGRVVQYTELLTTRIPQCGILLMESLFDNFYLAAG